MLVSSGATQRTEWTKKKNIAKIKSKIMSQRNDIMCVSQNMFQQFSQDLLKQFLFTSNAHSPVETFCQCDIIFCGKFYKFFLFLSFHFTQPRNFNVPNHILTQQPYRILFTIRHIVPGALRGLVKLLFE